MVCSFRSSRQRTASTSGGVSTTPPSLRTVSSELFLRRSARRSTSRTGGRRPPPTRFGREMRLNLPRLHVVPALEGRCGASQHAQSPLLEGPHDRHDPERDTAEPRTLLVATVVLLVYDDDARGPPPARTRAERAPTAIRRCPARSCRHASYRSPSERAEWSTATSSPKRALKRATVCGVKRDLRHQNDGSACPGPAHDCSSSMYTSVLPDPVTPCRRNGSDGPSVDGFLQRSESPPPVGPWVSCPGPLLQGDLRERDLARTSRSSTTTRLLVLESMDHTPAEAGLPGKMSQLHRASGCRKGLGRLRPAGVHVRRGSSSSSMILDPTERAGRPVSFLIGGRPRRKRLMTEDPPPRQRSDLRPDRAHAKAPSGAPVRSRVPPSGR